MVAVLDRTCMGAASPLNSKVRRIDQKRITQARQRRQQIWAFEEPTQAVHRQGSAAARIVKLASQLVAARLEQCGFKTMRDIADGRDLFPRFVTPAAFHKLKDLRYLGAGLVPIVQVKPACIDAEHIRQFTQKGFAHDMALVCPHPFNRFGDRKMQDVHLRLFEIVGVNRRSIGGLT